MRNSSNNEPLNAGKRFAVWHAYITEPTGKVLHLTRNGFWSGRWKLRATDLDGNSSIAACSVINPL